MSKRPEEVAKHKVAEAGERLERGIDDAASGLRKKGADFREYLKQVHADVEEWKFGVEESKDGFRVEWRVVALIKRPKKNS
jgi:hypothetical protein